MKLFYEQTFRISRLSKIYRAFRRFTSFKNDACNAFITKIKEPRVQTQFLVAGVERFELPNDGVRVRSLTAWRHPNIPDILCPKRQPITPPRPTNSLYHDILHVFSSFGKRFYIDFYFFLF